MRLIFLLTFALALYARADELDSRPSFQYLQNTLANAQQVRTVAQGLSRLKAEPKFSDLFRNYTLGFDSKSLQSSTPQNPRAILFGSTGHLIITFNGHPQQSGGYTLEVAEFSSKQNKVFFREIIFKSEIPNEIRKLLSPAGLKFTDSNDLQSALGLEPSDIDFENSRFAVTKPNPQKCLTCHAVSDSFPEEAGYIWNGYANWPGFYGSHDDGYSINSVEWHNLKTFMEKNKPDNKAANVRYATLEPFMTSLNPDDDPKSNSIGFRPNLRMTLLIALHQARLSSRLLGSKIFAADAETVKTSFCKFPTKGPIVEILKEVRSPHYLMSNSFESYDAAEESWIGGAKLGRYVLAEVTREKLALLDPEFNSFFKDQMRENHFAYFQRNATRLENLKIPDAFKADLLQFINYVGPYAGPWDRRKFENSPFYIKSCRHN